MKKNVSIDLLSGFSSSKILSEFSTLVSPEFTKPIFILSAPRSGSSYLYEIVRRMKGMVSFDAENSPLWFRVFTYSDSISSISDYIELNKCTDNQCQLLKNFIALKLFFDRKKINYEILMQNFILRKPFCYVEKTISNCFHLNAIEKMFPDAIYIHLVRDGRSNISSMIEAWNTFVKVGIPPLPKTSTIKYWSYAMPPGWYMQLGKTIEEISAWSWIEHNRYILEHFDNQAISKNLLTVKYEDLVNCPVKVIENINNFTGLEMSDSALQYINSKQQSWSTISSPKKDKWKEINNDKIERIISTIQPMMNKLEYTVE